MCWLSADQCDPMPAGRHCYCHRGDSKGALCAGCGPTNVTQCLQVGIVTATGATVKVLYVLAVGRPM